MDTLDREHLPDPGVAGEWEEFKRGPFDDGDVAGMRYRGTGDNVFLVHEGCAHVLMAVDDLVLHPDNPRKGDVPMIRESLRYHGQFDSIIVNRGSYSKRYDPWTIGAGNHTFKAACEEGWTHVGVQVVDVDDEELDRIMLVHNAASDAAHYDRDSLLGVTERLGNLEGTGVTPEFVATLKSTKKAPESFPSYGEDVETKHECPRCGYEWS